MDQCASLSNNMQAMKNVLEKSEIDWYYVADFWNSPQVVQLFKDHGYTLYTRMYHDGDALSSVIPSLPFDITGECSYPYAYHNGDSWTFGVVPLRAGDRLGKVMYAQDSQLRHVAIKVVFDDSDEYRIMRFLHNQGIETLRENCIVPVLDLLPFDGFWFVVMPRWSVRVPEPQIHTMKEVLHVMHSMLKVSDIITKTDIKMANVLINHFADDPYDTAAGEFEYYPFAFDVGCLGVEFCIYYQHYSHHLPMSAPLLDKTTRWDIENRFTAAEALQFFEEMRSKLTEDQLNAKECQSTTELDYVTYDRWQGLPEDFKLKWASFSDAYLGAIIYPSTSFLPFDGSFANSPPFLDLPMAILEPTSGMIEAMYPLVWDENPTFAIEGFFS
ncbi:hypothetical protein BDN70DRAFT_899185 [Pholiota conissans]|uniref:Protein kinase domain-containing protein n=1 Tax=Pholiota conissans TaxID=109636 RepID=A0A9P5YS94_9AGAR|nr:hypothetical protein BDN70DRAFT_899185 [Pholiota conissans]